MKKLIWRAKECFNGVAAPKHTPDVATVGVWMENARDRLADAALDPTIESQILQQDDMAGILLGFTAEQLVKAYNQMTLDDQHPLKEELAMLIALNFRYGFLLAFDYLKAKDRGEF